MSDDTSSEELYSAKSSKVVYKRSRSRQSVATRETLHTSPVPRLVVTSSDERRESTTYLPVAKWAIDYNNKNYIRSKCNKNIGLHRRVQGRPLNYHIEYDNNYHVRSKVNPHKGLHRKQFEVKRKYAPDRDDLADATGWEFDWGPEIDQIEQDVPFIPEGRIVTRGGYRWYGVRRNDSDCDVRQEDHRENLLNEALLEELKTGHEFLQADVPHLAEGEKRKYNRGAYRCYEVQRNVYDIKPELPSAGRDPEWRRKYHSNGIHYLDLDRKSYVEDIGSSDHRIVKGKPFKRTVLNKVYELKKEKDSRDSSALRRRATRLSFVPGEGEKTLYEGVPDRFPASVRESPSIRSVFKKKTERYRSQEGSEYEEYERHDTEERHGELTSKQEDRLRRMASEKRRSPSRSTHDRDEGRLGVPSTGYAFRAEANLELEPRRASRVIESPSDVRKGFKSLNEEKQTNRHSSHSVDRSRKEREELRAARKHEEPRRHRSTSISSARDVREEYETWKDNVENTRREREREDKHTSSKRERKRSESFRNYNRGVRHKSDVKMSKQRPKDVHHHAEKSHGERRKIRSPTEIRGPRMSIYDEDEGRAGYKEHEDQSSMKNRVGSSRRVRDRDIKEMKTRKDEVRKKINPQVKERMREIQDEIERKFERMNNRHQHKWPDSSGSSSEDIIDFEKHKSHPKDRGHSHNSEYEKYVTKNGSEYWVKKEEKFAELRHKDIR